MWVMKCRLCPITSLLIEFQRPLPRSLQYSDIKNHGRIRPEKWDKIYPRYNYVWSMQYLDMVEPWCTQDPYKDQYARFLHG